jgi:hypothetical protein
MSQLFQRKPIADLLVDEADSSRSLKIVAGNYLTPRIFERLHPAVGL